MNIVNMRKNYHIIKKDLKSGEKNFIKVIYKKVHFPKLYS